MCSLTASIFLAFLPATEAPSIAIFYISKLFSILITSMFFRGAVRAFVNLEYTISCSEKVTDS